MEGRVWRYLTRPLKGRRLPRGFVEGSESELVAAPGAYPTALETSGRVMGVPLRGGAFRPRLQHRRRDPLIARRYWFVDTWPWAGVVSLRYGEKLPGGVTVTHQVLVLVFQVRILAG